MKSGNILITGISTGIGRDTAIYLANNGFNVWGTVRTEKDFQAISSLNIATLHPVMMDVTSAKDIDNLKNQLNEIPLAGLINNAGIALTGPLKYLQIEKLKKQFEVNVFGLVRVTQAFIPNLELHHKLSGEDGRIINISSVSGKLVTPFNVSYASSKFAVEALSDGFRRELVHNGIKVTLIEPGPIKTAIWNKALREDTSDFINEYAKLIGKRTEYVRKTMENALPVNYVPQAIYDALIDYDPPIRKIVTKNAEIFNLVLKMPDSIIDYISKKKLQLAEFKL